MMNFVLYLLLSQFAVIQSLNLNDHKFILAKTNKLVTNLACYTCSLLLSTNYASFADSTDLSFNPTLQGVVTVKKDLSPVSNEISALYITAREDTNVFQSGVLNNKPPPLLTKRIAGPITFPLEFTLNYNQDATPEATISPQSWAKKNKDILVSVRLDTDGIAATRADTDLIGKDVAKSIAVGGSNAWSTLNVELSDRGIGGKFVTRKN